MKGLALRPVGASQTSTRATMHPSVRGEGGSDAAHFFRLPGARFFVPVLAFAFAIHTLLSTWRWPARGCHRHTHDLEVAAVLHRCPTGRRVPVYVTAA